MHPLVLGVPAFLVVLPFAVIAGLVVPLQQVARHGANWHRLLLILLLVLGVGLLGAKLFSVLERGESGPVRDELGNGFRYPGAIIAMLIAAPALRMLLPRGVSLANLADWMAPGIGIGLGLMRVHCLLSGCCTGWPCSYAWCMAYPHESPPFEYQMIDRLIPPAAPASLPVHPLPVYFLIASFGSALFALWFLPRARYAGQTFLAFVLVHETLKGGLEFFRYPPAPLVQAGSLALAALALAALAIVPLRRKARAGPLRAINP